MRQKFSIAIVLLFAVAAIAQNSDKPQVNIVPAPYTAPDSGKAMYNAYCASCHGMDAKGNGPAAPAMKSAVPDLTLLATSHGGEYPAFRVAESVRGDDGLAAHGSKDMPVWGPIFSQISQHSNAEVQQRIRNLTAYIESLQKN